MKCPSILYASDSCFLRTRIFTPENECRGYHPCSSLTPSPRLTSHPALEGSETLSSSLPQHKPSSRLPLLLHSTYRSICFWCFSSRACAFICCTSMVSGLRRRIYSSWFPMHRAKIRLLILSRGA